MLWNGTPIGNKTVIGKVDQFFALLQPASNNISTKVGRRRGDVLCSKLAIFCPWWISYKEMCLATLVINGIPQPVRSANTISRVRRDDLLGEEMKAVDKKQPKRKMALSLCHEKGSRKRPYPQYFVFCSAVSLCSYISQINADGPTSSVYFNAKADVV